MKCELKGITKLRLRRERERERIVDFVVVVKVVVVCYKKVGGRREMLEYVIVY